MEGHQQKIPAEVTPFYLHESLRVSDSHHLLEAEVQMQMTSLESGKGMRKEETSLGNLMRC